MSRALPRQALERERERRNAALQKKKDEEKAAALGVLQEHSQRDGSFHWSAAPGGLK